VIHATLALWNFLSSENVIRVQVLLNKLNKFLLGYTPLYLLVALEEPPSSPLRPLHPAQIPRVSLAKVSIMWDSPAVLFLRHPLLEVERWEVVVGGKRTPCL